MYAQIKRGVVVSTDENGVKTRGNIVVSMTKGVVDPMATRRVCEPLARVGGNIVELADKIAEVQVLEKKKTDNIQAAKNMKRSPVMRNFKRSRDKAISRYEIEHKRLLPLIRKARGELYELKAAYIERRRGIYKDNAVYSAPGGCLPANDEVVKAFKSLKPGEFLGVEKAYPPTEKKAKK